MCGRFTSTADARQLAAWYGVPEPAERPPRFNVAPSQAVAAVGLKADGSTRGLAFLHWGFVPRWAKSPADGPKPINAKAETVATNAAFRQSFRDRRCLVPCDGFYEWLRTPTGKRPYYFRPSPAPVALAAVWDVWTPAAGPPLHTFAVLTVPANAVVQPLHDRMPALLDPADFAAWLSPATPPADLQALLRPFPAARLTATAVSVRVNSPKHDDPACLTADAGPADNPLFP